MKFIPKDPPRAFEVGMGEKITLHDCGQVQLEPNEMVTFVDDEGGEFDLARKSWGYYATPSLNSRLPKFGLRSVLVKSDISNSYFILLVKKGHEEDFQTYLTTESMVIVTWLDTDEALGNLKGALGA